MKALTAKRAVLYQGRMYEPGDTLPAGDSKMVEAWLEAESAEWTGEEEKKLAERVGFEPTDTCASPVFKTGSFNRSDISPYVEAVRPLST